MTGRELIVYILENHLEDEPVFKNGKFVGFMTISDAAIRMDLGTESIRTLASIGRLPFIKVEKGFFIPERDVEKMISARYKENKNVQK